MLNRILHPSIGSGSSSHHSGDNIFSFGSDLSSSPYTGRPLTHRERKRKELDGIFLVGCVFFIIGCFVLYYRSSYYSVISELQKLQEMDFTNQNKGSPDNQLARIFEAERTRNELRENAFKQQMNHMQLFIQRESWRIVNEYWGEGPHRVTFTVKFFQPQIEYGTFKVEMASYHHVPHVNHFFLEQVHHELWDGTWFYFNGPHVLQAGPQDWEEQDAGKAYARFAEARLDSLIFPEYSPEYPHEQWTLGFAGRPGGPEFYINKADNSELHGPEGQMNKYDENVDILADEADPCFAHVIEGHETLLRIFHQKAHPRDYEHPYLLWDPVEIVKARYDGVVKDEVKIPEKLKDDGNGDHHHPYHTGVNQESIDVTSSI